MSTVTAPSYDSAHDILRRPRGHPLDVMFDPKSVAVVGATETASSVGRSILENLTKGGLFKGAVYPVNPKRPTVLGLKAYPNVGAIPEKVDAAVIVTPAPAVPGVVAECAKAGIKAAVIISAGFKEVGPEGVALERQVLEEAKKSGMRIIGPNCLGVMVPHLGYNATFASTLAKPGSVALISQSGALCTAVLDWSLRENVGFSAFVSIGSMLDVGWGDLIYYLGDDPRTKSIVVYMETIGDARAFLSAAREVSLTKPIIVIKVGRTEAAAKAAASHTGSMTGSDEVLHAAFRRVGVLRVETIAELFHMAHVLAKQPRPRGPRLAIVTNAGGPGALATDMLITHGGQLAEMAQETRTALDALLPQHWSHNNPMDILGDAGPERYAKAVEIVAKDPNNDGLLVVLTPQAMTDPTGTADALKGFAKVQDKPVLASWMGGSEVDSGRRVLNRENIPNFDYPDTAARAFVYMWRYSRNLQSLYETPQLLPGTDEHVETRSRVEGIVQTARKQGRTILTEFESKQVLESYGIPTVPTKIAKTEAEAVKLAGKIDGPAVLKLHSRTITHKTDVGGVHLNLHDAKSVRAAYKAIVKSVQAKAGKGHFDGVTVQPMVRSDGYELIIGSSVDSQFGPVLLFGTGGQLVEVFRDRALGFPPLNATLARRLMEQTKIYTALQGVRGRKAVDLQALEEILVKFSHLVVEQPWIKEIDINPLLASSDRLLALDARVVLHGQDVTEEQLPKPAIRPYPRQYVRTCKLKDGSNVTLRPIRPEDEPQMVKFHQTLSERSVYYRYFSVLKLGERIAHDRLIRICFNDYDREIALVAERKERKTGEREILGVGRLSRLHGLNEGEFALIIADQWQNKGLGTQLLKLLSQVAKQEKLERLAAHILPDNHEMQHVCKKVGFDVRHEYERGECHAQMVF